MSLRQEKVQAQGGQGPQAKQQSQGSVQPAPTAVASPAQPKKAEMASEQFAQMLLKQFNETAGAKIAALQDQLTAAKASNAALEKQLTEVKASNEALVASNAELSKKLEACSKKLDEASAMRVAVVDPTAKAVQSALARPVTPDLNWLSGRDRADLIGLTDTVIAAEGEIKSVAELARKRGAVLSRIIAAQ